MTDLLYYDDAYVRSFEAVVTGVENGEKGFRVALDRTAFYPGGGGQPCDEGWLDVDSERVRVAGAGRDGGELWHTLERAIDLAPGARVGCTLDWERRYRLMRTHTAMHILCGVVWRDYGALVTGGNMEPGEGRMDFEFASLSRELITEVETCCNLEVAAAHEIRTQVLPRHEAFQIPDLIRTRINLLPPEIREVRTVEIVGLDLQADGGTHVANTRDVGRIQVVDYKSKGAINKRIYIRLA